MVDCIHSLRQSFYIIVFSESTRNEYRERIESLKKAWALIGTDLKTHGK